MRKGRTFYLNQRDLSDLCDLPCNTRGFLFFNKEPDSFHFDGYYETGPAKHVLDGWGEQERIVRPYLINGALDGRLTVPYHRREYLELMIPEEVQAIMSLATPASYDASLFAKFFGKRTEKRMSRLDFFERVARRIAGLEGIEIEQRKSQSWKAWISIIGREEIAWYAVTGKVISAQLGGSVEVNKEPELRIMVSKPCAVLPAR